MLCMLPGAPMTRYSVALAFALAAVAGCGTTNETLGTAGGAVIGGVAGNAVGRGSTAATVGGAAVGGIVGHVQGARCARARREDPRHLLRPSGDRYVLRELHACCPRYCRNADAESSMTRGLRPGASRCRASTEFRGDAPHSRSLRQLVESRLCRSISLACLFVTPAVPRIFLSVSDIPSTTILIPEARLTYFSSK